MNKKGDIGDLLYFITIIFSLGILFFIGGVLWYNVVDPVTEKMMNLTDNAATKTDINESFVKTQGALNMLDPLFAFFFFGFFIALLMSVFFLDTSPGYLVFALVGMLIVIFTAGALADSWINIEDKMSTALIEGGKVSPSNEFQITNHLVTNMPIYLTVMSSIFLIVLYASRRME